MAGIQGDGDNSRPRELVSHTCATRPVMVNRTCRLSPRTIGDVQDETEVYPQPSEPTNVPGSCIPRPWLLHTVINNRQN